MASTRELVAALRTALRYVEIEAGKCPTQASGLARVKQARRDRETIVALLAEMAEAA